ncbi:MAG: HNH endonuclease [Lachnospiraceae bacterium]|nr:HNH endonuclease [Lachnospiraceae bacterium]
MLQFEGYEVLTTFKNIDEQAEREVHNIQIPKDQRKCLFCGKDNTTTTFNKVAHAVSETVGNKSLISYCECDKCNEDFGKVFEDNLGKYMLPYKIVTQTFGKNKQLVSKDIPKDESISYDSYRIQVNKNTPIIEGFETKGLIIEKRDTGIIKKVADGFEISIPRQHYFPPAVYCSFLKMAYSILPLDLYKNYVKHFVVLQQLISENSMYHSEEEKREVMSSMENCGLYCFVPGINPLGGINVILWKKMNLEDKLYPQMLFTLEMKNFSFTIPVVGDDEEGSRKMPRFSSDKDMQYNVLDFTKEETEFKCLMKAEEIEILDYELLEEELRNHKLLK